MCSGALPGTAAEPISGWQPHSAPEIEALVLMIPPTPAAAPLVGALTTCPPAAFSSLTAMAQVEIQIVDLWRVGIISFLFFCSLSVMKEIEDQLCPDRTTHTCSTGLFSGPVQRACSAGLFSGPVQRGNVRLSNLTAINATLLWPETAVNGAPCRLGLDSTSVTVHPDGTGALQKKRAASHRQKGPQFSWSARFAG